MVDGRRFINGSTGTIAAVRDSGAVAQMDDGAALVIPAGFVSGQRIDGTPNMSHGWARTIDGAQGGTWEQAHLLATPNLDRLSAYVAQSRSRQPTHTWNTAPEPSGEEHGNVVIDPSQPAAQVLAAVVRVPERRLAAADDPFVLDRRLSAERDEHEAALADAPPDLSTLHARLTGIIEHREQEARRLWDELGRLDHRIAKTGVFRQLRPDGRGAHRDLLAAREATGAQLQAVHEKLREDRTMANRAGSAVHEHTCWVQTNQWRHAELDRIDRQLADHWADTVLAAVHQDDPLAYGLDRLRNARAVLATRQGTQSEHDVQAVDFALGQARVARIRAVADGGDLPVHLAEHLGPAPVRGLARDVWCGLALHIERRADRGLALVGPDGRHGLSIAQRLTRHGTTDPLDHPRGLIVAAQAVTDPSGTDSSGDPERWLHAVERATEAHRAREQQRSHQLDHGLGISL